MLNDCLYICDCERQCMARDVYCRHLLDTLVIVYTLIPPHLGQYVVMGYLNTIVAATRWNCHLLLELPTYTCHVRHTPTTFYVATSPFCLRSPCFDCRFPCPILTLLFLLLVLSVWCILCFMLLYSMIFHVFLVPRWSPMRSISNSTSHRNWIIGLDKNSTSHHSNFGFPKSAACGRPCDRYPWQPAVVRIRVSGGRRPNTVA